jgi:aminoglycoside phosphotransferase (APT) family kinase protein
VAEGVRKDEEFSGTKPVEERHRIDELSLDGWMRENVEGYQGPLTVLQFKGGQSNPTYRLDTPGRSYVMRRKPFGKLLPSAHAVDREFRVIAALSKQGFPVARAYALCTDDAVIGAAFYIMSMEEGRVFWDPTLPRSRRSPGCIPTIRKPSGSAISASRGIISRVRSIAGPSSIARPRPSTFPKSKN